MKRLNLFATIATAAIVAASPALAEPGGHGGGDAGAMGGAAQMGRPDSGATIRDQGRVNSEVNSRAIERANENSVTRGANTESSTTTRGHGRIGDDISTGTTTGSNIVRTERGSGRATAESDVSAMSQTTLTGVTTGMTVVDSNGATVGTVTGISTVGNGSIRSVQVTLSSGQIITLAPSSLSSDGTVLTTNSLTTNVNSQGAAHANINGLIHASPNSALSSTGVTTLTGLATGLTVATSGGTSVGTVSQVFTNRSGAVVGIQVDLAAGGSVIVPATTLSMDGTTVVTSSTQF